MYNYDRHNSLLRLLYLDTTAHATVKMLTLVCFSNITVHFLYEMKVKKWELNNADSFVNVYRGKLITSAPLFLLLLY